MSSFSSIALHPLPLVGFSIRRPSRLADALHSSRYANPDAAHGVINILAAHQSQVAIEFSRSDLYEAPFSSTPHRLENGLPVIEETVGALMFSVLTSLPLSGEVLKKFGAIYKNELQEKDLSSELFVARVTGVLVHEKDPNQVKRPLVYYQGGYVPINPN
ncbi:SPT20 domain-containing protein [Ceratobasidium sp. AG-Ba]|nr:SPT20 domain-containing protein [Ceratobasidium sp. AG-Ba]QRW03141.1 SPT20 domain-containing protein [Ceratobasidium sp. AG-Ba]